MRPDSYTVKIMIDRLRKVYARKSVQPDAVACDNIRLVIRQLMKYTEAQQADTEPIDIFNI